MEKDKYKIEKEYIKGKVFQNFNRKSKWLGLIDYKSLTLIIIYVFAIWEITSAFDLKLLYRSYILVIFSIPVLSLTVMYASEESVLDMVVVVLKYIFSPKRYVHVMKNTGRKNSTEKTIKREEPSK